MNSGVAIQATLDLQVRTGEPAAVEAGAGVA